jgi:hypothetical protein
MLQVAEFCNTLPDETEIAIIALQRGPDQAGAFIVHWNLKLGNGINGIDSQGDYTGRDTAGNEVYVPRENIAWAQFFTKTDDVQTKVKLS